MIELPKERPLAWFGGRTASQVARDAEREAAERRRERQQVIPPAQRPMITASWYCMRSFGYCGCPSGLRCSCGKGYEDHDPGDE